MTAKGVFQQNTYSQKSDTSLKFDWKRVGYNYVTLHSDAIMHMNAYESFYTISISPTPNI